jgi:sulfatase maturation enzyme AslB (radical SAM superfamily)
MLKPRGAVCNLDCRYCFCLPKEDLYDEGTTFFMPDDVLEAFTRQYIEAQRSPHVTCAWQGVQPSLCIHAQACGNCLAMEHNGDVFSCDYFVGQAAEPS